MCHTVNTADTLQPVSLGEGKGRGGRVLTGVWPPVHP